MPTGSVFCLKTTTWPNWIQEQCLSKKAADKQEWDAVRYLVYGKMFALVGNDRQGRPIVSVKHTPESGQQLREACVDIVPGYYLNKRHWSSVFPDGDVPEKVLAEMLDDASYRLVVCSLRRNLQRNLL